MIDIVKHAVLFTGKTKERAIGFVALMVWIVSAVSFWHLYPAPPFSSFVRFAATGVTALLTFLPPVAVGVLLLFFLPGWLHSYAKHLEGNWK